MWNARRTNEEPRGKPRSTSSVDDKISIYEHEVVKRTYNIVQLGFNQHYSNATKKPHTTPLNHILGKLYYLFL